MKSKKIRAKLEKLFPDVKWVGEDGARATFYGGSQIIVQENYARPGFYVQLTGYLGYFENSDENLKNAVLGALDKANSERRKKMDKIEKEFAEATL
jgi:hypothetical protein